MKVLSDGTGVIDRVYYYLLDYNDMTSQEYIIKTFKKNTLFQLNKEELLQLLQHAIAEDSKKYIR